MIDKDRSGDRETKTETDDVNAATPSDVLAINMLYQMRVYLADPKTDKNLQIASPNGEVVYKVLLENGNIFFQNGSITTQLNARPMAKWHGSLRMTNLSLAKVNEFIEEKNKDEQARRLTASITSITSFYAGRIPSVTSKEPEAEGPKKPKLEDDKYVQATINSLKELLSRSHYRSGELSVFQEPPKAILPKTKKTFVILSIGNKKASDLVDKLLMDIYQLDRQGNETVRGGSNESMALKLAEAAGCRDTLVHLLMRSPGNARVFIKNFGPQNNSYDFPRYTITVLILEENEK